MALISCHRVCPMQANVTTGAMRPGAGGIVVPHQPKSLQCVVAWLVFVLEKFVTASLRCKWRDYSGLSEAQDGQPVIFCLWHSSKD